MIRICLILVLIFSSTTALSAKIADVPAKQVAAHTYVIHGPLGYPDEKNLGFMNNPGFVITKTGVVVIDPGSSRYVGEMVLRQIRKITDKPVTHVLNTHIHGYHWLGNDAFKKAYPKAMFIGHPGMITGAKNGAAEQWLDIMDRSTKGATKGTKAVIPKTAMDDSEQFKTGGITFKIYAPKKAHSNTDIMIFIPEESVMFLGDNVLNRRIGRMDDASFRGNINACDVAINTAAKVYVPGHGLTDDIKMVSDFRSYLTILYQQVGKYYEQGLTDFEMKPKIIPELAIAKNWNGFEAEVGKHISLATLEVEAAEFE